MPKLNLQTTFKSPSKNFEMMGYPTAIILTVAAVALLCLSGPFPLMISLAAGDLFVSTITVRHHYKRIQLESETLLAKKQNPEQPTKDNKQTEAQAENLISRPTPQKGADDHKAAILRLKNNCDQRNKLVIQRKEIYTALNQLHDDFLSQLKKTEPVDANDPEATILGLKNNFDQRKKLLVTQREEIDIKSTQLNIAFLSLLKELAPEDVK